MCSSFALPVCPRDLRPVFGFKLGDDEVRWTRPIVYLQAIKQSINQSTKQAGLACPRRPRQLSTQPPSPLSCSNPLLQPAHALLLPLILCSIFRSPPQLSSCGNALGRFGGSLAHSLSTLPSSAALETHSLSAPSFPSLANSPGAGFEANQWNCWQPSCCLSGPLLSCLALCRQSFRVKSNQASSALCWLESLQCHRDPFHPPLHRIAPAPTNPLHLVWSSIRRLSRTLFISLFCFVFSLSPIALRQFYCRRLRGSPVHGANYKKEEVGSKSQLFAGRQSSACCAQCCLCFFYSYSCGHGHGHDCRRCCCRCCHCPVHPRTIGEL